MPFKKLNGTKLENKTIYKIPMTNISWNELNTLQAMINIICLLTKLTDCALYEQMPLIITQLNTGDLVSMGTEGNITPLFFDGSFIISIFEKWFFKMIETIKYIQLCITLEIESMELWNIPLALLSFQWEKKGHWLGEQADMWGENIIISSFPLISRTAEPGTWPGQLSSGAWTPAFSHVTKTHQVPVNVQSLVNSGKTLSHHMVKDIRSD